MLVSMKALTLYSTWPFYKIRMEIIVLQIQMQHNQDGVLETLGQT